MKRHWNLSLWIGFLVVLAGLFSYQFLAQFPITRDFPWVNLLLFALGGALLIVGLFRAFGRPQNYRGKIFGPILAVLSVCGIAFFSYVMFYVVRQVPASRQAPRLGEKAPEFQLPDQSGKEIALADLVSPSGALLIFYRGHW